MPWLVVDPDGVPVEPVYGFLAEFVARDNRAGSVRSYAYALLRWWRWLRAVDVAWDQATPAEVRDLVLWLRQASKPRRSARTASAATAGTVNRLPVSGTSMTSTSRPRCSTPTRCCGRFTSTGLSFGNGPLINPVQLARPPAGRTRTKPTGALPGPRARSGTTRRSPSAGRARCQTSGGMSCSRVCGRTGTGRSSPWRSATAPAPAKSSASGVWTWTGVISSCGCTARAAEPSSGCRPARKRSSGSALPG